MFCEKKKQNLKEIDITVLTLMQKLYKELKIKIIITIWKTWLNYPSSHTLTK